MTQLLALLAVLAAGAAPAPATGADRPAERPSPAAPSPDALFSRRALRRARLLIQMRLFQLHEERLECVREALLRRLPAALWPEEPSSSRGTPDAATAMARCDQVLRF